MDICGQGILAGQGACEPRTITTPIWYLDANNNVVSGKRVQTRTCNPDTSTVAYFETAGEAIATPTVLYVQYTVTAQQGELVALETAGNDTLASILTSVDELEGKADLSNAYLSNLQSLQTSANNQLTNISGYVDGLESLLTSPYPTTLAPGAAAYAGVVAAFAPANLAYFSLSLVALVTGAEFSVNAGTTWLPAGVGTITWGNNPRAPLSTTNLRFRSNAAGASFQLIWEA